MPTLNVRDVPEELAAAIDAAAVAANARSRETFLRDLLKERFGPAGSVVSAIAARGREIVEYAQTLGRFGALTPAPTVPAIARAIGHPDPSLLESELRGERPFSFSDGDRLCELFGIDRKWFEAGTQPMLRFATRPKFYDCSQLLHHFNLHGIGYGRLYFILGDGDESAAAIIGHSPSEDPNVGWRYDLLVAGIPIHDRVGGTGAAQRRAFADLVTAIYFDDGPPAETLLLGMIMPYEQYAGMVAGYVHPSTSTNPGGLGAAQSMSRTSDWFADFPSFRTQQPYTTGYTRAHAALMNELREQGIESTLKYVEAVHRKRREHPCKAASS